MRIFTKAAEEANWSSQPQQDHTQATLSAPSIRFCKNYPYPSPGFGSLHFPVVIFLK